MKIVKKLLKQENYFGFYSFLKYICALVKIR